jgi:hypothetical protein
MTWAVREGAEHNYIDGRTHVHQVHLFNQVTGGEHNLSLLLGCPKCRDCGRPFAQSDLGTLDPAAEINTALEALKANHDALMKYAGKHQVPVRLGSLASVIPAGHRLILAGDTRLLHSPRVK